LELANANFIEALSKEEKSNRKLGREIKALKESKSTFSAQLTAAEADSSGYKEELDASIRSHDDTKAALDKSNSDNETLIGENQALSNKNAELKTLKRNLKDDIQKINQDLAAAKETDGEKQEKIDKLRDRLRLCIFCLQFLAPIRRRRMLFPLQKGHECDMEAGNKAAHGSNLLVDIALFSLKYFKESDKEHFQRMYDFSIDDFVGSYANLEQLIKSPKLVELTDVRGAMVGFFGLGDKLSNPMIDQQFLSSERKCKQVLAALYKLHPTKTKARQAYAADSDMMHEHVKMMALIQQMRTIHKNRGAALSLSVIERQGGGLRGSHVSFSTGNHALLI
jgi:hypothetical protein